MIQRLRWKFVLINMIIVTVVLAVLCTGMVTVTRDSLRQESINMLYQASDSTFSVTWPDYDRREEPNIPYFTVLVQSNGTVDLVANQFGAVEDTDQLMEIVETCMKTKGDLGVLRGYSLRYLRQKNLMGWSITFVDTSQERSTVRSMALHMAGFTVGTLVVFFFISLALAKWATRPVEQSWQQQRQFVSDASHELKTPLTVILTNIDLLQSSSAGRTEQEQRWLENIRASSGQMHQLVEELLTLARSDNLSPRDRVREAVSLSELIEEELLLFEPTLYEAGKELREDIAESMTVVGDPGKLRRLADILLDNARKYGATPSVVTVSLQPEGARRVRLSVNSEGAPIPKEQLERIFERFYRADQARTSEGFGLGLSIAFQIAEEHGGRLWAESDPEKGNTFFFSLPRGTK